MVPKSDIWIDLGTTVNTIKPHPSVTNKNLLGHAEHIPVGWRVNISSQTENKIMGPKMKKQTNKQTNKK